MTPIAILLLILGGLAAIICGFIWFSFSYLTKHEQFWEKWWNQFNTPEKNPHGVPEDVTFNVCLKCKDTSSIICIIGLIVAVAGVCLLFIK